MKPAWIGSCLLGFLAVLGTATSVPGQETPAAPPTVRVALHTNFGDIVLALEKERAPVTTANFLRYVEQKRLDNTEIYRAVGFDDEGQYGLIQGGLRGNPKRVLKPIAHEPTSATGLSHTDGAISMARAEPGTADADFFIVAGDSPGLDAHGDDPGYAVFGHVTDGMDIVHTILKQPRSEAGEGVMKGQMLAIPVKILTARRVD